MVESTSAPNFRLNSRLLPMSPGMYIFRFATQLKAGQQAFITLQPTPSGKTAIDLFPSGDVAHNTLTKLGDCIIVRVHGGNGGLLVTQYSQASQPAVTVDLRVDRIDTSAAIVRAADPSPAQPAAKPPAPKPPSATVPAKSRPRKS